VNVTIPRVLTVTALLAATLAACADQPTEPRTRPDPEQPKPAPIPLGLYEVTLTMEDGASSAGLTPSRVVPLSGPSAALNPAAAGLVFEQVSTHTFVEGTRSTGGQRFIMTTFRVRNSTGGALSNVTLIPVTRASTISGTPFSSVLLFNGAAAPAGVASQIVPSGAVMLGEDTKIRSRYPDALQVFLESEVAAITPPADVTGIFPYGFVVSNPATPASRSLPNTADANQFSGIVTFAFRYPLQATAAGDPFSIGVQFLAVQDTETRMTESVEERQDTAGVRRLRDRATALGATTVTVLGGSPAADPFVTDYPGQRQICSFRTAGPSGAPTTTNIMPGFYTELTILRPGEATNACGAYFISGTAQVANYGMGYNVTARALDRYGNVKTTAVDSVQLSSSDGTAAMPPRAALVSGLRAFTTGYTTYGLSTLTATGRRIRGTTPVFVNGMTRTWGGGTNTQWLTNTNWTNGMYPGSQDSVIVPGDRPNYPLLVANTAVPGITMVDGASVHPFINLSSFDFTISGDLVMGNNGTFTGTGRVVLTGNSNVFGGGVSNVDMRNLRITGRYSTTSNINVTGGRIVVQGGRLRSEGKRVRVRPT
jgi:hypothetical protein